MTKVWGGGLEVENQVNKTPIFTVVNIGVLFFMGGAHEGISRQGGTASAVPPFFALSGASLDPSGDREDNRR